MTSISLENTPRAPIAGLTVIGQGIALLALGFVLGYVAFGNPSGDWGTATYDSAPLVNEDWHGNVRRSVPTK